MTELSRTDDYILRYIGLKSPTEIGEKTGIEPDEVVRRGKELLSEINVLTLPEKIARVMLRLEVTAEEVYERLEGAKERNLAGLVNSMRGLYTQVLKELREVQKNAGDQYDAAMSKYAMMMSEIVGRSFERTLSELKQAYPDVPTDEIEAKFQRNLLDVSALYEEKFNVQDDN